MNKRRRQEMTTFTKSVRFAACRHRFLSLKLLHNHMQFVVEILSRIRGKNQSCASISLAGQFLFFDAWYRFVQTFYAELKPKRLAIKQKCLSYRRTINVFPNYFWLRHRISPCIFIVARFFGATLIIAGKRLLSAMKAGWRYTKQGFQIGRVRNGNRQRRSPSLSKNGRYQTKETLRLFMDIGLSGPVLVTGCARASK